MSWAKMATEYKIDMDDDNDVTVDGQCADEKTRSRQSDEPILPQELHKRHTPGNISNF